MQCEEAKSESHLLAPQAFVDGLDEHVAGAVLRIVVERQFRGFHLIEVEAALDGVLHAVADDGDHVAIFDYVGFGAEAAVAGDDAGAAVLQVLGNGEEQDVIQGVDFAFDAAAAGQVEERDSARG